MNFSDNISFELRDSGTLIRIEPVKLTFPNAELDWDRNWLQAVINIKSGVFSGQYEAEFMTTDFELFKRGLKTLTTNFTGTATFKPLEEQLTLDIKGDGLGHFVTDCVATPQSHVDESLSFTFNFDQTILPDLIRQLENITKAFPINGDLLIQNE